MLHRSMPNLDGSHSRWAKAARGALSFSGEVQSPRDVQTELHTSEPLAKLISFHNSHHLR